MTEGAICVSCGDEFDYDAPQHLLPDMRQYDISVRLGLDAPLLCENCDLDEYEQESKE